MEDNDSTRLERLQAAQDRLLRYAHFRLGEELTKSQLGVDSLPANPSSPGVWDLEFDAENAQTLGLAPNSFDSFAQSEPADALGSASGPGPKRNIRKRDKVRNTADVDSVSPPPTRTTFFRITSDSSSASIVEDSKTFSPKREPPLGPAGTSMIDAGVDLNGGSSALAPVGSLAGTTEPMPPSREASISAVEAGGSAPSLYASQAHNNSKSVDVHYDASASTSQLTSSKMFVPSSSELLPLTASRSQPQIPTASNVFDQSATNFSSTSSTTDSVQSKADSALSFLMSRSKIVEPSVQALLNQVDRVGKMHHDEKLAKILRPRPSHTFGTTRALEKQIRRQKIRRKRYRAKGMSSSASEPVFRSSTKLREILDSKPVQRVPRRLASLASKNASKSVVEDGKDSKDTDLSRAEYSKSGSRTTTEFRAFGAASQGESETRRLNPHLNIPKGLRGKEPTFLPLEWFDSEVKKESQEPAENWRGVKAKSRWYGPDGDWEWNDCVIQSYDKETSRFKIRWTRRPESYHERRQTSGSHHEKTESSSILSNSSFFVTGMVSGGGKDGHSLREIAEETAQHYVGLVDENGFPTVAPPPTELPCKYVSRLNLWIPERETERQLLARAVAARTQVSYFLVQPSDLCAHE